MERPSALLPHVDELVMEYLLFRGFTKSFQVFSAERKRDRSQGFDAEQIISQLLVAVQNFQLETVLETWQFFHARFFHHLDASYASILQQLETSLLRLYVINAVKSGHREKAMEFFEMQAEKLNACAAAAVDGESGMDTWSRWFILPYIEHPESDSYFQKFFSQSWLEAYVTSLRNFLSLVFRSLPLPKLLAFQLETLEEPAMKLRLKVSQSEATRLRMYNSEATTKIKKLEEAGRQLHSILRTMVQHSLTEHLISSSYVDTPIDWNKNRSRSRSHGAATASVGLSQKQMKDIGELFGIGDDDSAHVEAACVDPRDIPRIAEVYLPADELIDDGPYDKNNDEEEAGDSVVPEGETSCYSTTPIFSPIASSLSAVDEDPSRLPLWTTGGVSLIREFNMLNDWKPTQSVMTVRSRFSSNGQYLAIAKLGNTHIDIWSADPVSPSTLSTITLPARLTGLGWLSPTPHRQLLACTLIEGDMMLWDADGLEVTMCPPNEDRWQAQQLMCASEAPVAACLLSSRDEEDNTIQQVVVLHGGVDQPTQDYLPMEGKQLTCIAWSNVGDILITGNETGSVEFINVSCPGRIHRCDLAACCGPVLDGCGSLSAIALSPDGTVLLSAHENAVVVMQWFVAPIVAAVSSQTCGSREVEDSVIDVKPKLTGMYEMDKPLALRNIEVDTTIRFLGTGGYFVVADSSALYIFKRGEKHALSTFLPNQASIADFDFHPHLPVSCSANQEGAVSLWSMKED
ncbi:unnamed protein product [Hyaloperonospora brassicae]|uniref:ARMC9 CTLH-like domain-containing protein n=1 Tax=Hyaloperonospora brassicae TaxID=162125 RepID=A0AAV0SYM6_HYABA|nr:unnamed protein product [Hyaloperonospora brassicae]